MSLPELPARPADSHKGTYGRVLIIGGSLGMSGAVTMSALAALRTGAGLVTVATPASCVPIVAAFHPSYMTIPLPEDGEGRVTAAARERLLECCQVATAVAIGPGLGRHADAHQVVTELYGTLPQPLVVDADGLDALSTSARAPAEAPRVLTPHLGEFRHLVGKTGLSMPAAREEAVTVAAEMQATVLLKGHETLVTDGNRSRQNETGNPGMATGGSGDVLTGMVAGLLSQGMSPFEAATLGAYLHGLAGDLAAASLGMHGMIATDLIDYLPSALLEYSDPTPLMLDDEG